MHVPLIVTRVLSTTKAHLSQVTSCPQPASDIAIPIATGDTYCASAFVRSQAGGTASGSFTLWMLGDGNENGTRTYRGLSTKENWTPVSTCATATHSHSALRIQFYPGPNRGTTNIDDVAFGNFRDLPKQQLTSSRRPRVQGRARVGRTLTARPGSWLPATSQSRYRWMRGGRPIAGASGRRYRLRSADRGKRVAVNVTAKGFGYLSATVPSASTRRVRGKRGRLRPPGGGQHLFNRNPGLDGHAS